MGLSRDYVSPEVLITEKGVPDDLSDGSQQPTVPTWTFLRQHLEPCTSRSATAPAGWLPGLCCWTTLNGLLFADWVEA